MSIERIKELRESLKLSDTQRCDSRKLTIEKLLCEVSDYLIEEHEQKVKETLTGYRNGFNDCIKEQVENLEGVIEELNGEVIEEPDAILGNTVEVGQIWRTGEDNIIVEVTGVITDNSCKTIIYYNYGEGYPDGYCYINTFVELYELVTMENIKENEWTRCRTTYSRANVNEKYIIGRVSQSITSEKFSDFNELCIMESNSKRFICTISSSDAERFVPCLPPMEEETKEPAKLFDNIDFSDFRFEPNGVEVKLRIKSYVYTQEQLDKAVKEAREEYREEFEEEIKEWRERVAELINQNSTAYSEGFKSGKNTVSDINKMSIGGIRNYLMTREREEIEKQAKNPNY